MYAIRSYYVGVANIKYKIPVSSGAKLIAKAEVKSIRRNNHIVWVFIYEKQMEVFRGKSYNFV